MPLMRQKVYIHYFKRLPTLKFACMYMLDYGCKRKIGLIGAPKCFFKTSSFLTENKGGKKFRTRPGCVINQYTLKQVIRRETEFITALTN